MDKIKKTINLEQFKNRFYSGDTEFGKTLSKNIFIPQSEVLIREVEKNLPLLKGKILRYGTMLYILRNLRKILRNMAVFQVCLRPENTIKLARVLDDDLPSDTEFIFTHGIAAPRATRVSVVEAEDGTYYAVEDQVGDYFAYAIVLNGVPRYYAFECEWEITNGIEIGQYIFVSREYDFLFKKFYIEEDGDLTAPMIARAKYFYNFAETEKYQMGTKKNFIPIMIYLEQEAEDMGLLTSVVTSWIPYKVYYLGERVVDGDGILWRLVRGAEIDYANVHPILKSFFDEQKELQSEKYVFVTAVTQEIMDGACTDLEKTYVLEDEGGNYQIIKSFYSGREINLRNWMKETDSSVTVYTAVTESRLSKFYHPDIDDNSAELPFRVAWTGATTETGTTQELVEYEGEPYYNTTIPFSGDTLESSITEDGIITFTYSGGSDGIVYTESYAFNWDFGKFNFSIDDKDENPEKWFRYMNIDLGNGLAVGEKKESNIEVRIERDGTESQAAPYFKEEALLGIQDLTLDIANLNIERGKSAAFERHSILGEVSTFDDLEKYRNGFFTMKDD